MKRKAHRRLSAARPPPTPPHTQDLTYSVPSATAKGERAYLLKSVSGHMEPGQMAALMGPSGSGKTTLLDVLAGRKTTGTIEGDLRFAGHVGSREFLRRYTGYVEQFGAWLAKGGTAGGASCVQQHGRSLPSAPFHPSRRHASAKSHRV